MSTTFDAAAFNRGTDPVLAMLTVEQARHIVGYRADESLRERIEELAEKSGEGRLSEQERAEYEGYVKANKFVALLQTKARKLLERSTD